MTALEISEIFAWWAVNWPNAEMFQGDVDMLDLRCKMFAAQFSDVDYWDGMLGAAHSIKTRKYAPNVAEFSEDIRIAKAQVEQEVNRAYLDARSAIRLADLTGEAADQAIQRLPKRTQTVIRAMGGLDAFIPPEKDHFNMDGFVQTYRTLLKKRNMLTGETYTKQQKMLDD